MEKETVISMRCAAAGETVQLTLQYAVGNGFGCAVDCSCVDGSCSRGRSCPDRGGRNCELQKWMQEDLL